MQIAFNSQGYTEGNALGSYGTSSTDTAPTNISQPSPAVTSTGSISNYSSPTTSTTASGGTVTDYGNGGKVYSNPLDNPNYKAPSGTPTSTTQPTSSPTTTTPGTSAYDSKIAGYDANKADLTSQMTATQKASENATNKFNDTVNGILNGSVPLSPYEQAQMDATKASFQSVIQQQELANKNFIGGTETAQETRGLSRYSPEMAQGNIFAATTEANKKIADLNTKMNLALADMEKGFRESNYKMVKDSYDALQQSQKDKTASLEKMYNLVQDEEKKVVTSNQEALLNRANGILLDSSISLQDRRKKIAELIVSGNLTTDQISKLQSDIKDIATQQENERHNKIQEELARDQLNKGAYEVTSDGRIFNKNTGKFMDDISSNAIASGEIVPGKTGNPLLDNNTKTSESGIPFIDGTNFKGKQADAMQLQAAKLGIPYLSKDGSDAVANIDTARANMSDISNIVKDILPPTALDRLVYYRDFSTGEKGRTAIGNTLADWFQSDAEISSFGAFRSAAIQAMRAMAGSKGLRINEAEILQSVNQDIPKITDTLPTAQAKLARVNALLDNQEKGLFGKTAYNNFIKPQEVNATAPKIEQAIKAGYNPDEIVNKLKADPTVSDKVNQALQAGYSNQDIVNYFTQ